MFVCSHLMLTEIMARWSRELLAYIAPGARVIEERQERVPDRETVVLCLLSQYRVEKVFLSLLSFAGATLVYGVSWTEAVIAVAEVALPQAVGVRVALASAVITVLPARVMGRGAGQTKGT